MRELRADANEIAVILRFNLPFQSLRDYFGDISEFHILDRMFAVNEIVQTSKGKIIRTLDLVFV
jgi:AP-4 complex subunit sigma-1